ADQLQHLSAADLTRFINHHDGIFGHCLSHQEICYGRRGRKARLHQPFNLLTLRGKDNDLPVLSFQTPYQFPEHKTLSRAGPATEQGDSVPRLKKRLESDTLLVIQ